MFTIILMRPQHPGNIGAVARVMANFEMEKLIIIDPECDPKDQRARNRAKHAQHVIDGMSVSATNVLSSFDYVIGTTAQTGTDFNIARSPIDLRDAAQAINRSANIALVFGSEGTGLTNEEIAMCDFVIKIHTGKKYPTLNLSHAVAITLYELHTSEHVVRHEPPSKKDMQMINSFFDRLLDKLEFATPEKRQTQKNVWKKIFAKAMLTKREAFAVFGLLRKLLK